MSALSELKLWIHELLHGLLEWVESFAGTPYGGWALFLISFAESSFFPVPPDVLLIALCLGDPSQSFVFATICAAGSVLGGMAGYGIGFYGGRPLLKRWFKAARLQAVEAYYDRYNAWAIGIAGLTPLPYKLFTISGGAFSINFRVFVVASILSRSARFFLVAGLIYLFGESIRAFIDDYLGLLTIAFVILLILGFWLVGRRARGVADRAVETGDS
jgi:membrane protein YqaA with SNARE-associated domain